MPATPTGLNGPPQVASQFMSPNAPIGGTPGNGQGRGANVLSLNLGGVNVNYDMGPSTGEATNDAYSFLGNSFNADSALLGNTIVGSQNFLSGFANPVLAMAQNKQSFNTQVLPSMFGTLSAQNFSLGSQAVQAEAGVAQASVAASSAASAQASSGGGCFITTAVCQSIKEADDGPTLTTLRAFRDGYMQGNDSRKEMINVYYREAPKLIEKIKARPDHKEFFECLYLRYIKAACEAVRLGENELAFFIYSKMLYDIQQVV
jgi:hypothetical protein